MSPSCTLSRRPLFFSPLDSSSLPAAVRLPSQLAFPSPALSSQRSSLLLFPRLFFSPVCRSSSQPASQPSRVPPPPVTIQPRAIAHRPIGHPPIPPSSLALSCVFPALPSLTPSGDQPIASHCPIGHHLLAQPSFASREPYPSHRLQPAMVPSPELHPASGLPSLDLPPPPPPPPPSQSASSQSSDPASSHCLLLSLPQSPPATISIVLLRLCRPASIFSSSPHLLCVLPYSDLRPCPDPSSRRPDPAARSASLPRRPDPLRYAAALPKSASQPSLPRSALVGA